MQFLQNYSHKGLISDLSTNIFPFSEILNFRGIVYLSLTKGPSIGLVQL